MMNGTEFIKATDGKQYYMDSFLKSIIYGYQALVDSKYVYSRSGIHKTIKSIQKSNDAHNEIEDYLCTDLVTKYIKPNLGLFGLQNIVVDNGVRESKDNVTTGHLDIKFQVPSLSENHYYAFEAKRLDKSLQRKRYYLEGGIQRFTDRVYYPETTTVLAGMIGFVEVKLTKCKKSGQMLESKNSRVPLDDIKDNLNKLIGDQQNFITTQSLISYPIDDVNYSFIRDFQHIYLSKHTRDEDKAELKIYHLLFDYYNILLE